MARRATHGSKDNRELMNQMRRVVSDPHTGNRMPEAQLWSLFCELRNRGLEDADRRFLMGVKTIHRRRSNGGADISVEDPFPKQHLEVDDPFLGELWKAYKRCIQRTRLGAAAQLFRDIEAQLSA